MDRVCTLSFGLALALGLSGLSSIVHSTRAYAGNSGEKNDQDDSCDWALRRSKGYIEQILNFGKNEIERFEDVAKISADFIAENPSSPDLIQAALETSGLVVKYKGKPVVDRLLGALKIMELSITSQAQDKDHFLSILMQSMTALTQLPQSQGGIQDFSLFIDNLNAVQERFLQGTLDQSFIDQSNREMTQDYRQYIQTLNHTFFFVQVEKSMSPSTYYDMIEYQLMFLYSEIQKHFWSLYEFQNQTSSAPSKEAFRKSSFFPEEDKQLYNRLKEQFPDSEFWEIIESSRNDKAPSQITESDLLKVSEIQGFVFKAAFEIPAGSEKMLLQGGSKVPYFSKLDQSKPYCAVFAGHTDGVRIKAGQAYSVEAIFNLNGRQIGFELAPIGAGAQALMLQCGVAFDVDSGAKGVPTLSDLQSALEGVLLFSRSQ